MAGMLRVPRSRGALSGVMLVLLGAWGALIPFIGPYFGYAYTPGHAWTYTPARLWLEIVPGAAAAAGGLILLASANRAVAAVGAWLAALAGAWFLLGPALSALWASSGFPQLGVPAGGTLLRTAEQIGFFTGLGAVIIFCAALALGRMTVVAARDTQLAAALAGDTELAMAGDTQPTAAGAGDARLAVAGAGATQAAHRRKEAGMLRGFKTFLMQGNLVVIAVALVVALAFSTLIKAFTDNVITPLVNAAGGGGAAGGLGWTINGQRINLGAFISAIIYFVIFMAVIYFLIVVPYRAYMRRSRTHQDLPGVQGSRSAPRRRRVQILRPPAVRGRLNLGNPSDPAPRGLGPLIPAGRVIMGPLIPAGRVIRRRARRIT